MVIIPLLSLLTLKCGSVMLLLLSLNIVVCFRFQVPRQYHLHKGGVEAHVHTEFGTQELNMEALLILPIRNVCVR